MGAKPKRIAATKANEVAADLNPEEIHLAQRTAGQQGDHHSIPILLCFMPGDVGCGRFRLRLCHQVQPELGQITDWHDPAALLPHRDGAAVHVLLQLL
jgi:hypothetical protein